MNLNLIRIGTVRVHAPYKYPPRNTMPKSPGTNSNQQSPGAPRHHHFLFPYGDVLVMISFGKNYTTKYDWENLLKTEISRKEKILVLGMN